MQRGSLGPNPRAVWGAGDEVGLALDRRGAGPFRQVQPRSAPGAPACGAAPAIVLSGPIIRKECRVDRSPPVRLAPGRPDRWPERLAPRRPSPGGLPGRAVARLPRRDPPGYRRAAPLPA